MVTCNATDGITAGRRCSRDASDAAVVVSELVREALFTREAYPEVTSKVDNSVSMCRSASPQDRPQPAVTASAIDRLRCDAKTPAIPMKPGRCRKSQIQRRSAG